MKGPPQVSERSAETAAAAPHRPAGGRGSFVAGRCILQTTRAPAGAACRLTPPARVVAQMKRHNACRHSSAPVQGDTRYQQQGSRDCRRISWAMRGPDCRTTSDRPGPGGLLTEDGGSTKSRSKRFGEPLPPLPRPERSDHATGLMIADAVRYMSVHSWTQWDSHGLSGTSPGQKQQPARPGKSSSRAISAGGGRCWVRTNVG